MKIKSFLAISTALAASIPAVAYAQSDSGDAGSIVVTARRVEERLQDVPISITVFNQKELADKNVVSAADLATFTPSLSANTNYGSQNTTFAIRGFAQDTGTAPSVGTYFADVVTPRGASNGLPTGDGASAGDFFDLQNVQVLKGPQGTLFGRNTTGGAVLFVPQKPTDKLEGYVQGSVGNYNMYRLQGVINVPLSDTFRVRLSADRMKQDGYLNNITGIGPKTFDNTDYTAVRLSIVGDLTPDLENYIIASYSRDKSSGALDKLAAANASQGSFFPGAPVGFGSLAAAQLAQQGSNFYNVENALPNAGITTTQWQVIDTTTFRASDSLTIKNIASFAELKQQGVSPIFGIDWQVPVGGQVYTTNFQEAASPPGEDTADESTFTEEFRLQGITGGGKFNWQAGAYLELANPLSPVGSQSPGFSSCVGGSTSNCTDPIGAADEPAYVAYLNYLHMLGYIPYGVPPGTPFNVASVNYTVGETTLHDAGLYAQGTYKLTDQIKATGGFRYTWDTESIDTVQRVYSLAAAPTYGETGFTCTNAVVATPPACDTHFHTSSNKPTWLIDLDYTPTDKLLAYAKYARGYRAATIAPNIPEGGTTANPDTSLNYVKPERVDAFEAGLKTSFGGAMHGIFNIAGFYNKFDNQQLQVGFLPKTSQYPETAAPVNAGKSTIWGAEVEASLTPVKNLEFTLGYTYLHTRIDQVLSAPSNPAYNTQPAFNVGDPEVLSPRNKFNLGANYSLPIDPKMGKLSVGASVTYRSSMLSNFNDRADPDPTIAGLSKLPALTLVDANLNWRGVAGSPVDLALFVTNLTNKQYYTFAAGVGSTSLGFEVASVGAPRMVGGSIKIHFGS